MELRAEGNRQKAVGRRKTGFYCLLLTAFCLLTILSSGVALACPSCKEAASSSENPAASAKLTKGWARSIYLLMWTPYLLFGGAAFAIVRSARRTKR
jgi:hypothetical protein